MNASTAPTRSDQNSAVITGFFGWTLDAFDYFLVVYCLTAIGKEFHRTDTEMSAGIAITLMMRPVGGFIFGLLADRYGRRRPLMANLVFISVIALATSFAPGYNSFLVLRALFGIGMGGVWGVGGSLALEKVPVRIRGLISGLLQEGYALGNLLAALCFFFLFDSWGWRPMFLLGCAPALVAVYIHFSVKESEVWQKTKQSDWGSLGATIFANRKLFFYLVLLMTFMNFCSHGTQDLYPTFLQRYWHFDASKRSMTSMIAGVGAIIGGITGGYFSDRIGRRKAIVISLLAGILVVPLWSLAPTQALLIAGAFLMQFMVQSAWGVIPAHLSELSPDSVRGFLPGFAYQCGTWFSSMLAPAQTLLATHVSYAAAMALTVGFVFIGASIIASLGRERKGQVFGQT